MPGRERPDSKIPTKIPQSAPRGLVGAAAQRQARAGWAARSPLAGLSAG
jgi:hypothetical protein